MNNQKTFLSKCIPVRILLVLIALYIDKEYLPYYGLLLLIPAIGFLSLYFGNLRLNAPEGGGKTWWFKLRIIHGLLYLSAALLALSADTRTYIPLTIDVILGFMAFLYFHYVKENNLLSDKKLCK
jgi:hypothetical protein